MSPARDSAALRHALATALGDRYRVERELGGGGMSQTYVATETALDRRVVIKALAPHLLEGLSVERFQREILTAARLQHPHVVPVLSAGDVDGVPWFTMPYVEGQSLRLRLADGPLPVAEAVDILRDVARALAYAHDHGVIHRDIKPDNVLLSGGSATVTDFGIAKAVTAARTLADAGAAAPTLTQAGTAIGTPAYMAPEQAAADPSLDHRADIYAFGALACELLTGEPPFPGRAPTALLLAHLHEPAPDVRERRPEIPPALAALVTDCLAKSPDDRPADAATLVRRLGEVASGSGSGAASDASTPAGTDGSPASGGHGATQGGTADGDARRRPSRLLLVASVVAVVAIALVAAALLRPDTLIADGTFGERESLVVADFRAPTDDTMLGVTIAEALRADLTQSANLSVLTSATVRELLDRMQRPRETRVLLPVAREVATREGARAVVDGEVVALGTRYVLTARLVGAVNGEELATFREEAAGDDDLVPAVGRLSRAVREKVGESVAGIAASPPLERVTTRSLPALRQFVAGRRAQLEVGDGEAALRYLEEAVTLDSTFAMAWRAIAVVLNNSFREPERANAALERAMALRDRLSDDERLALEGYYHMRGPAPDVERAVQALSEILRRDSTDEGARNNLGVLYSNLVDLERIRALYEPTLDDPRLTPSALLLDNFAQTAFELGDTILLKRTMAAMDSLHPDAVTGYRATFALEVARGDYARADAIADSVIRTAEGMQQRLVSNLLATVLAGRRGRPTEVLEYLERRALPLADGDRALADLFLAIDSLQLRAFFFDATPALRAALRRASSPARLEGIAPSRRPWASILYAAAALGDSAVAARALRGVETETLETNTLLPARRSAKDSAAAAAAAGRWDEVLRLTRRAGARLARATLDDAYTIARAHDRLGRVDSAIVWFRFVATTPPNLYEDAFLAPSAMKRLGELHDARGDVVEAIRWYEAFVREWADAEPSLRPVVDGVRARIDELRRRATPG